MKLKFSAKWANRLVNCTPEGRANGCGGKCCRCGTTYYPSRSFVVDGQPVGHCPVLADSGCNYGPHDKPLKCLLYPFDPKPNGTCYLHFRGLRLLCRKCLGGCYPIILNQYSNIVEVFGNGIAAYLLQELWVKKQDCCIETSREFDNALRLENYLLANNVPPPPRSKYHDLYPAFFD